MCGLQRPPTAEEGAAAGSDLTRPLAVGSGPGEGGAGPGGPAVA